MPETHNWFLLARTLAGCQGGSQRKRHWVNTQREEMGWRWGWGGGDRCFELFLPQPLARALKLLPFQPILPRPGNGPSPRDQGY